MILVRGTSTKLTVLGTELTARIHVKQLKRQHLRSLLSKSDSIVLYPLVCTNPTATPAIDTVECFATMVQVLIAARR